MIEKSINSLVFLKYTNSVTQCADTYGTIKSQSKSTSKNKD